MATAHPVQISIDATLATSLGSAVRGAEAQLNQLGSTMSELGNRQSGIKQLGSLRSHAKDAALEMRAARKKVSGIEAEIAAKEGDPSAKQARALERAKAAATKAEETYRRQRAAVDELSASLTRAGMNTRAMGAESARLGSQLEILRTRHEALTRAQQGQARNLENRSAYRTQENAARMGVAFDLSGEKAGAAMTGLRTIFGLNQDGVVKLGDAINHLSNNTDAKASDLLDIANRAGSTAKLFGLSGEQLNALGASFLALKTKPEVAATGINALLMKLSTAANLLSLAWTHVQTGALGLIAPIKSAALAFWAMLPAIGATTVALLANPITWIVVGIGAAVAGLALVIRQYWDPIAAYLGGVFKGIRAGIQPAITSLTNALAPLAPVGSVIAKVFGFIADGVSRVVGWIGRLLEPVTRSQEEFKSLSASGQSLGTVIGTVLGGVFTLLTLPIRLVGALVGWMIEKFTALTSFSPLETISAAWQPVADFMGALWSGITDAVGKAIGWIAGKIGWVTKAGSQVGDWFGSLSGDDKQNPPGTTTPPPTAVGVTPGDRPAHSERQPLVGSAAGGARQCLSVGPDHDQCAARDGCARPRAARRRRSTTDPFP